MHRFPSKSVIFRFRIGAILFVLRGVLLVLGLPLLSLAMLLDLRQSFFISIAMLGSFPIVAILHWLVSAKARCPLCFAQPLLHKGCSKSRKAQRLLWSYRLKIALDTMFLGHFRCQYCGEPSQMKARERGAPRGG